MLRTVASALCVVLWTGCLVTDEITFNDDPDLPPAILNKPGFEPKIGGLIWIDKSKLTEWPMQVQIRDENVRQDLVGHWRIKRLRDEGMFEPRFDIAPVPIGDEPVRDFPFNVQTDDLREGECHRLELAVSGSFFINNAPRYFDEVPAGREDDFAYAWWWIWEGDGDNNTSPDEAKALLDTCNASEQLLMPAAVNMGAP